MKRKSNLDENNSSEIEFKEHVYEDGDLTKLRSFKNPVYTISHPPNAEFANKQNAEFLEPIEDIEATLPPDDECLENILIPGEDRRELIEDRERLIKHPYSAVIRLISYGKTRYAGTGVLVGPYHVLTCGHNLFLENENAWAIAIKAFAGAHEDKAYFGTASACYGYKFEDCDLALLILDQPLGQRAGWLTMATYNTPNFFEGRSFQILGYPTENKKNTIMYGHQGDILKSQYGRLFYDIDTSGGQSGSPILEYDGSQFLVIGIHTAGECLNQRGNRGVYLTSNRICTVVNWVKEKFIPGQPGPQRGSRGGFFGVGPLSAIFTWIKEKFTAKAADLGNCNQSISNEQASNEVSISLPQQNNPDNESLPQMPLDNEQIHLEGERIVKEISRIYSNIFKFIHNNQSLSITAEVRSWKKLKNSNFISFLTELRKQSGHFKWKELTLFISSSLLTDISLSNLASIIRSPCFQRLELLNVKVCMCPEITIEGVENFAKRIIEYLQSQPRILPKLRSLAIELNGCEKIQKYDFKDLNNQLNSIKQLETKAVLSQNLGEGIPSPSSEMEDEERSDDDDEERSDDSNEERPNDDDEVDSDESSRSK